MSAPSARPSAFGVIPVRLLDADPELAAGLAAEAAARAQRHAVVPAIDVPAGAVDMRAIAAAGLHPFGILVTSGLLVRDVVLGETVASELLGPGDVAALEDDEPGLLSMQVRWSAAEPARVALLDDRLLPIMRAWPELGRALLARSTQRAVRVEAQRAISQLARVEDRLVALFGMLAERFARITPAGVVIDVYLTHAMLGRLVGARRPTVSLALKALADEGSIVRRQDGSWLLSLRALDAVVSAAGEAPPTRAEANLIADHGNGRVQQSQPAAEIGDLRDRIAAMRLATQAMRTRAQVAAAQAGYLRSRVGAARPAGR